MDGPHCVKIRFILIKSINANTDALYAASLCVFMCQLKISETMSLLIVLHTSQLKVVLHMSQLNQSYCVSFSFDVYMFICVF